MYMCYRRSTTNWKSGVRIFCEGTLIRCDFISSNDCLLSLLSIPHFPLMVPPPPHNLLIPLLPFHNHQHHTVSPFPLLSTPRNPSFSSSSSLSSRSFFPSASRFRLGCSSTIIGKFAPPCRAIPPGTALFSSCCTRLESRDSCFGP